MPYPCSPARAAAAPRPIFGALVLLSALAAPPLIPAPLAAQQGAAARLEARPAQVRVTRGDSVPFRVVALDAAGNEVDAPVRVSGPRGAVRIGDGYLVGVAPGEHTVAASAPSAAGEGEPLTLSVDVRVEWPAVATVALTPREGRLYAGTTLGHVARAQHADSSERPDADIRWSSSNEGVATVDAFGNVTAHRPGTVTITARAGGAAGSVEHRVAALAASSLSIAGGETRVRTGDVQTLTAMARTPEGAVVADLPVLWAMSYQAPPDVMGPAAPGQVRDGKVVVDVPGTYTVLATAGPLTARHTFQAAARDVVRSLDVTGMGSTSRFRTTDFWVFEGVNGRDYAITGSKLADGHAFMWDVTDPANIVKTDSVQADARAINDVKVSPDGRYATMTREGASDRRNGVVILDLANPAHPRIAAEVTENLTGGVHNAFPTDTHVFALSGGDKYVILDVTDLYAPRQVGEYNHPESSVHDVWVLDGLAFTAEWGTGLVVTDVGDGRWGGSVENPAFVTSYPLPTGRTHAAFPYKQASTGKYYVFVGDEIMNRRGLALESPPGTYSVPWSPENPQGGVPLGTTGHIQVIDFTDPESPEMVARYEVSEYGTHNIWVEDDVLYQGYYEGGLRVVDVSGELMGNLYTQGREMAAFKAFDPQGFVPNSTMVWSAMPHKGHIFFTDTNSGLWAVRLAPPPGRPVM